MNNEHGNLLVISAPSGAGKSTLIARLFERLDGLAFSVSWTTRSPRPGETDGVDYHFVDEDRFRREIAADGFFEWAEVHGRLYGTPRAATERQLAGGVDVILDIDVQGAVQVRRSGVEHDSIFILPPDAATLRARLAARGTEDESTLARRLANARDEIDCWSEYDYLVVNDRLDAAAAALIGIVTAIRQRRSRQAAKARRIAATFGRPDDE